MSGAGLKPCPFCGVAPSEIVDATRIMGVFRIIHRCKVIPPFSLEGSTPELVAEKWNTRTATIPDPHAIARAALEKAADEILSKWATTHKELEAHIRALANDPAALAKILGRVK